MAEYIARKEANEWVADWLRADRNWHPYSKGKNIPTIEVFDILSRIPAADVQPVKHGRWIDGDYRCVTAVCSKCKHLRLGNGAKFATMIALYCEHCGARMDGGDAK